MMKDLHRGILEIFEEAQNCVAIKFQHFGLTLVPHDNRWKASWLRREQILKAARARYSLKKAPAVVALVSCPRCAKSMPEFVKGQKRKACSEHCRRRMSQAQRRAAA